MPDTVDPTSPEEDEESTWSRSGLAPLGNMLCLIDNEMDQLMHGWSEMSIAEKTSAVAHLACQGATPNMAVQWVVLQMAEAQESVQELKGEVVRLNLVTNKNARRTMLDVANPVVNDHAHQRWHVAARSEWIPHEQEQFASFVTDDK